MDTNQIAQVIEILKTLTGDEIRTTVLARLANQELRNSFEDLTPSGISRDVLLLEAARVLVRQRNLDALKHGAMLAVIFAVLSMLVGCGGSPASLPDSMEVGVTNASSSSSSSSVADPPDPPDASDAGSMPVMGDDAQADVQADASPSPTVDAAPPRETALDPAVYAAFVQRIENYVRTSMNLGATAPMRIAIVTGTSSEQIALSQATASMWSAYAPNVLSLSVNDDASNASTVANQLITYSPDLVVSFAGDAFIQVLRQVDATLASPLYTAQHPPFYLMSPWNASSSLLASTLEMGATNASTTGIAKRVSGIEAGAVYCFESTTTKATLFPDVLTMPSDGGAGLVGSFPCFAGM